MSNAAKHRDKTTNINNQWTYRRTARWAIGWYHALSVMRALWFGIILGILLLIQYAVANYPSPYSPYPYQHAVSSWIGFAITLAILTGPTIWLLGLGKKHVVREPLRGAIWIIRGLNAAFLTYFLSMMLALTKDFNQAQGDWNQIPALSYIIAFVAGLCLWLIPFTLAKPLALRAFRELAFCVDSIYRQNHGKGTHLYIVRLLARGQLEVERVGDSDEYRIVKQSNTQTSDRSMMQMWLVVALAVVVLGACAFVARGIKETHANEPRPVHDDNAPQIQQVDTEHDAAIQRQRETEYQRSLVLAEIQRREVARQAEQAKAERDKALQRQRQLEYQQSLAQQEMRRREAVRLAEQAARDTLRLSRSWVEWDQRGNGTLVIQLANHGSRPIHINQASVRQGWWAGVGYHVPAGSTLTHRIAVKQEPIYIDLDTSLGVLRFDLVPE